MARAVLAVCAAALLCAGSSAAARADGPTTQDVTITGFGGVQLACTFVLPAGTPPDGGWPGLILFPGGGGSPVDGTTFATAGFAAVSCSERGLLSSGGTFDLAGPEDAKDAQAIFAWLAARPEVSGTRIGAEGFDLGGAEVWNAAIAGVPFKAIVAGTTWSSLRTALKPTGILNAKLFQELGGAGPAPWNTASGIAARSYTRHFHSLAVPTLMLNSRQDYFFDLSQDTVPYGLLTGPKRLLIGWHGGEDLAWFRHYLAGGPRAGTGTGVVLQHEPPDTTSTHYLRLPPTRVVSVNLPGAALTRSVFLTGGPLETFGGGNVTIRYSGASWGQVVATVSTAGGKIATEGAAPVKHAAGVLKIPLLNEMRLLPRGKKLTVTLSSHDATFGGAATGKISVGRVTLKLSVLARAVSH